ncbi:MAGUK p55 subfamily member 2-like [Aegotheles albertisi]
MIQDILRYGYKGAGTRARVQGRGYKGAGTRARVQGRGYKGAGTRARVQGRGYKGAGTRARVQGRGYKGAGTRARVQGRGYKGAGTRARVQGRGYKGAAMQQVLDNLMGLPGAPGAADLDLIFLRGIMESPIVRSLAKFDRHELLIYEEVARMPPFRWKTLVLLGAQGVGRRSLKNKLIMSDQACYSTTVPYTSRKPKESERDGDRYRFVSRGEMEADIKVGRYLEHGEYEGNLYGTKINSTRAVVEAGKMCILDVNPQAVKVLRTAEFVPYVVFIKAPGPETLQAMNQVALGSGVATKQLTEAEAKRTVEESGRIQCGYGHYFDLSLTNDDLERTFGQLCEAMECLCTQPQWVPISWVY